MRPNGFEGGISHLHSDLKGDLMCLNALKSGLCSPGGRRWKTKQNSNAAILHRVIIIIATICCILQGTLLEVTHLILHKADEVGSS